MPSPRIAQKVGLLPSPTFTPSRREREHPSTVEDDQNDLDIQQASTRPRNEGFRLVSGHKNVRSADHAAERLRGGGNGETSERMPMTLPRGASPSAPASSHMTRYNESSHTKMPAHTPAEAYALAYGGTSRRPSKVIGPGGMWITSTTASADQSVREQSNKGRKRVLDKGKERDSTRDKGKEKEKEEHTHGGVLVSKPIFDWITRKLGAGRRATITGIQDGGSHGSGGFGNQAGPSRLPTRYQEETATAARAKRIGAGQATDEAGREVGSADYGVSTTSAPVPIHQARASQYHDTQAPCQITPLSSTPPRTRIGPTPHPLRPQLSPAQIFPPVRDRMSVASRSETLSLRSYRLASPSERERRREANNPYPSIPMPLLHRGSIMTATTDAPSMSFLSRSPSREGSISTSVRSIRSGRSGRSGISGRSFSVRSGASLRSVDIGGRSFASSLRPRLSILERRRREGGPLRYANSRRDGSFYANRDSLSRSRSRGMSQTLAGPSLHTPSIMDHPLSHNIDTAESTPIMGNDGASGRFTPALADEDASIRPFPPSHPGSPTPSPSIISRTSRSASEVLGPRNAPDQTAPIPDNAAKEGSATVEDTPHPGAPPNGQLPDTPQVASTPNQSPHRRLSAIRSPSGSSSPTSGSGRSRQGSISTRPTTIRSFDSGPGIAHIAQAHSVVDASALGPPAALPTEGVTLDGPLDHVHSPSAAHALGVPATTSLPPYFHIVSPQLATNGHVSIAVSSPLREALSPASSGTTSPTSPQSGPNASPSSIAAIPPTSPANISDTETPIPLGALSRAPSAVDAEKEAMASPIGSAGHGSSHIASDPPQPSNDSTATEPPPAAESHQHSVQAPRHTPHHPFFNPHPSASPAPNASTLTLASSTFAQGAARPTSVSRLSLLSNGPSIHGSLLPHRASLPGQSVTWAEEQDEEGAAEMESSGSTHSGAPRRLSEPLSRSPRLGEIPDVEEGTQPKPLRSSRSTTTPYLAAPITTPVAVAPVGGLIHQPSSIAHRPPSIATSTNSFNSSEPYHHGYNRPASIFGATTGASFKTTHTGWTGASASTSAWALRFGPGVAAGADEGASMRALRRRGSAGSMESFESRWSWAPARNVIVQGRGDGVSA